MLILIITAVLLFRAWFVKNFLSFNLNVHFTFAIIANVFSYLTLLLSYAVISYILNPNTRSKSYNAVIYIVILSVLLDLGLYKYFWRKATCIRLASILAILNTLTWGCLCYIVIGFKHFDYERNKLYCCSNLKQIGLSLIMYAEDNNGYLPNQSGAAGFEMLRANDYLTENEVFACPVKRERKAEENKPLTEENIGYAYRGGSRLSEKNEDNRKTPIVWDKPSSHIEYEENGNVIFLDGHVEAFTGANWMEQAGIKKVEIQK